MYGSAGSHVAQVFHGHPGSGHVKVWRLAPLTLHVFVVVFLVLELWAKKKRKKQGNELNPFLHLKEAVE